MVRQRDFFGGRQRHQLFNALKYLVYALLSLNVYLFLQEELQALDHTFVDGFDAAQLVQVFSATIDTAAWVILLLLFELETSVVDDSRIHGGLKWGLHGIRGLCGIAIVWAFTGYYAELATLYQVAPLSVPDACALLGQDLSLLLDLDEYEPLDAVNCASVGAEAYRLVGFDIVADAQVLQAARWLAWTDVINAADWILVVVVLEIEVRLQLRGQLTGGIMHFTKYIKFVLYGILFAAAAYWGYAGDFLDFWDAALWLFAFIFIELNVFEWQYETSHQAEPAAV
jgi:hypothetical protein